MTQTLIHFAVFLATVFAMEWVSWAVHKYVLHGALWYLHKDHHGDHEGGYTGNDFFGILFASLACVLLLLGVCVSLPFLYAGLGLVFYGAVHFFMHDILVHQRFGIRIAPRGRYLQKMYQAHRLHHAVAEKTGAVSFGFLLAPPVAVLREQLRMNRARGAVVDESALETGHDWTAN